MSDLRRLLQQGDPIAHEPELAPAEVEPMRRAVLAAGRAPTHRVRPFSLVLVAGLTLVVIGGLGLAGAGKSTARQDGTSASITPPVDRTTPPVTRRQLQFATPGGTRVIWTFNADFEVR